MTIKEKKIIVTMQRLRELHDLAFNHPFRVSRTGSNNHYAEVLDELGNAFLVLVKKSFENSIIPYPWYPTGRWIWSHQYWTCILSIRGDIDAQTCEYMETMEHYLNTIHAFIIKGKLESFYMHFGYSSYNKEQHEKNPMRSIMFVYYPELKRWDMTKFWAEKELPREIEDLKHDEEQVRKCKTENWRDYYQRNVDFTKKRIEELKELIAKNPYFFSMGENLKQKKLVPIWIVWECREGQDQIRAIDTSEENAKRHKLALRHESESFGRNNKIWIEQTVLDHLFGWEMLQGLLNGRGQQDYASENG